MITGFNSCRFLPQHRKYINSLYELIYCVKKDTNQKIANVIPHNINIPKSEGSREVHSLEIEDPDITMPLKTKQVSIGIEAEPKFTKIGGYWDDVIVDKVVELLCKYQDIFPTKFSD